MGKLVKTSEKEDIVEEISFKDFFVPLTTFKALFWLVFIGIVVYANMLVNGFVWDDMGQIVNNNGIHNLSNIVSFFFGGQDINGNIIKIHAAFYRPLMETLFTVVYSFFGINAFFFHFVSLAMHIAIVILVYFLFRRFFTHTMSFLLALILLVHPLNSESVNYISAYNDLMYLFFGMTTILLLQKKVMSFKRVIAVVVTLFLSLLSKEPGFLFIPIILGYSHLYYKNNFIRLFLSCIVVVIAYFLLRTSLYVGLPENQAFAFSPFLHMSFFSHVENIPIIFIYYIGNFVFPNTLAIAQQWSVQNITLLNFYLPLLILIIFIFINILLLIKAMKKSDKQFAYNVIFFSIWFWVGLGLYLQIIPLDMTVADRWFYFPMIGLLGLIGVLFQIFTFKESYKPMFIGIAVIYLSFFSIRTIVRNTNWYSERSLYMHDITVNKNSFDLENLVGMIYFEEHNYKEANLYFQRSISLFSCSDAVNNLGYLYQISGRIQDAEQQYFKAVECSHGYKDYGNLVILLYRLHKYKLAEHYTKEAIQKFPNGPGLYFVLGLTEYQLGNKEDALKNLAIGYKLSQDPQIANAYQLIEQNKPVDLPSN